ncbi:melatonin receptor type 1A-like [Xenia sp. Carnegie-2017]|uniref:melatonin receptor type 1A-like n=1 Tax=Xenia sp. Carnegie-2017 TaxID=2897299 RepID=UPI001F03F7D2|nr:melatonin receptor type 1A-like [Xenia sp. Carnegie-2017]
MMSSNRTDEDPTYSIKSISRSAMSAIFAITALMGNLLVLKAIHRFRRLRTYSNTIICNLSLADVLFSTFVAPINAFYWSQEKLQPSSFTCHVTGVGALLFGISSIYTLVFVSIERFLAITYPLKHRQVFSTKVIGIGLMIIWLSTLAICLLSFAVSKYKYIESFYHCIAAWDESLAYTVTIICVGNVLPMLVLIYCNVRVFKVIRDRRKLSKIRMTNPNRDKVNAMKSSQKRASFIVMIVISVFVISWTPYCLSMLCLAIDGCRLPPWFMSASVVLTIANGSFNPLIYGLLNKNFRRAFAELLHLSKRQQLAVVAQSPSHGIPKFVRSEPSTSTQS